MIRTCLLGVLGTLTSALAPAPGPADGPYAAPFEEIRRTVETTFFDPKLAGLDWAAVGAELAPRVAAAHSLDEFSVVVNDMLDRLHASHTHFYTSRDPEYYQVMGIFRDFLKKPVAAAHPDNPDLLFPGIGIFTLPVNGEVFISGVLDAGPAAEAGLRVGDRIVSVNSAPFAPIGSFEGRVGMPTRIEVQRTAGASTTTLVVKPVMLNPSTMFLEAMEKSARVIQHGTLRVGYVHIWSYAGEQYQDLLETEIASGGLKDADALILDLRDGWGGASPQYLNLFNDRVPVLTQIPRAREPRRLDPHWRKPAALLINARSRSGKEIIAYGFQKYHFGPVIGERTAGAVLGGTPILVGPGMLLYLATSDVLVDGERLEGRGVTPDIQVPFTLPYAAGEDPQLDAAVEALVKDIRERHK